MRQAFIEALVKLAEKDKRIVLLTGDLGYSVIEQFEARFPKRFFNVGVAEQNMMAMATGLAESGLIPFVYSITPFVTMRAFEFIRNGPIKHNLPVRIIGVGCGMDYGMNGGSHYALEDIALMRSQPGMRIEVPMSDDDAALALNGTWNHSGPVYYRLRKDSTSITPTELVAHSGVCLLHRKKSPILVLALGSMAASAFAAVKSVNDEHAIPCVLGAITSFYEHPPGRGSTGLVELLKQFKVVITVEDHYIAGGLASMVSEAIAFAGLGVRVVPIGVYCRLEPFVSTGDDMNHANHINCASMCDTIKDIHRSNDHTIKPCVTEHFL